MDILNIFHLVIGFIICMFGSMLLRSSPRLGGFLLGGLIAAETASRLMTVPPGYELFLPLISFVLGGGIGALIAAPLYMVILILSSSALGAVIGLLVGVVISFQGVTRLIVEAFFKFSPVNEFQITLMVVFALVFGVLSLRYDQFMAMASTAYVGGVLVVAGLNSLFSTTVPLFKDGVFLFFFWMLLGLIGLVYQSRYEEE